MVSGFKMKDQKIGQISVPSSVCKKTTFLQTLSPSPKIIFAKILARCNIRRMGRVLRALISNKIFFKF